jgi:thiopurine S-methyltransferase
VVSVTNKSQNQSTIANCDRNHIIECECRRRSHGRSPPHAKFVPRARLGANDADLLDAAALRSAGLAVGSLQGVVELTCLCAIDPSRRSGYLAAVTRLLAPGGWLLGLFWCHTLPGGPPFGSDPQQLADQLRRSGLIPLLWEPARGSRAERSGEWLGLWQLPAERD